MMTGLIESGLISLTQWVPFVHGRAVYAQSSVRRFTRWLANERIDVHQLYGPLIQQGLGSWGRHTLYLALDTSLLWEQYCVIRISVIYRGRAIPLVWQVIEHASSSVAYAAYQALLDKAATLLPLNCVIVFLADRGFADTALMAHATRLGWHWRIRIKGCFVVYRRGQRRLKLSNYALKPGQAHFWRHVQITDERYGPVHLALAHLAENGERWLVVSDEPTDLTTLDEYGLRFDIEENFLDDKSNGFHLEASLIRSADALTRLGLVLAITTLYLVAQGTEVVKQGKRRWVDAHWFRGNSYLKIGWNWIRSALSKGWELLTRLRLNGAPDPDPARASNQQYVRDPGPTFKVKFVNYAKT
jgi:Transposase DDE domain